MYTKSVNNNPEIPGCNGLFENWNCRTLTLRSDTASRQFKENQWCPNQGCVGGVKQSQFWLSYRCISSVTLTSISRDGGRYQGTGYRSRHAIFPVLERGLFFFFLLFFGRGEGGWSFEGNSVISLFPGEWSGCEILQTRMDQEWVIWGGGGYYVP